MKPVVTFRAADIVKGSGYKYAKVAGVTDHPRLGNTPLIRTSKIVGVVRNSDGDIVEFETLNTIYRLTEAV